MLDDINQAIESSGGQWVNLRAKSDGVLDGLVVSADKRGKTFEGQPVLSRKSGEQRVEWVFVLETDRQDSGDDDGIRKFAANESAQRAIVAAVKESGRKLEKGGRLKIVVSEDPANDREQPTFKAKYEPPAPAAAVNVDDLL